MWEANSMYQELNESQYQVTIATKKENPREQTLYPTNNGQNHLWRHMESETYTTTAYSTYEGKKP